VTVPAKGFRFALVGIAVAALYLVLYAALLAMGLPRPVANGLAFLLAVGAQYAGQAAFTFEKKLRDRPQAKRFGVMIGLGLCTSLVITSVFGPTFGWSDLASAMVVTGVLPVQNYLFMSRWVFARRLNQMETQQ